MISGMALGIDGWGHQGALEAGGETYAVLGSGVMRCYPSCHQNLYEKYCKAWRSDFRISGVCSCQACFFSL